MGKSTKAYLFGVIMFTFAVSLFVGCQKYSSPNKVKRIITEGSWKINSLFVDGLERTVEFEDIVFTFSESGVIDVLGEETIEGKWSTNLEKNPTNLELQLTPFLPFNELNADWTLSICSKKKIQGEVQVSGAGGTDILILVPN